MVPLKVGRYRSLFPFDISSVALLNLAHSLDEPEPKRLACRGEESLFRTVSHLAVGCLRSRGLKPARPLRSMDELELPVHRMPDRDSNLHLAEAPPPGDPPRSHALPRFESDRLSLGIARSKAAGQTNDSDKPEHPRRLH